MKGLVQFLKFDLDAFLTGKTVKVIGCRQWVDYTTKKNMGTAVDCIIDKDDTVYPHASADKPVTNVWERITIKIPKTVTVPSGTYVAPLDATGTVYGTYRNQLSIKASDIRIIDDI